MTHCSIQQEAQPVFEQAACYGKAAAVKAAAIEALAITAFVASESPSVVDKCMTGFANLWKTGGSLTWHCGQVHHWLCQHLKDK